MTSDAGYFPLRQYDVPAFANEAVLASMRDMSRDLLSRIDARLRATGKTDEGASKDGRLGRDFIRDLRRKGNSPTAKSLEKLAEGLETSVAFLLAQSDDPTPTPAPSPATERLPIKFEVAAGSWLAVDEVAQEPSGWVEVAPSHHYSGHQWLERVRGDSFNQQIPDGAIVHVVDAQAIGYTPRRGDIVIAVRTRGQGAFVERTIKQVDVSPTGEIELWPRSFNPRYTTPLSLKDGAERNDDTTVSIVGKVIRAYIDLD